jgi:hypothetical protein
VHLDGYDQSAFLRSVSGSAANNNGVKSATPHVLLLGRPTDCSWAFGTVTTSTCSLSSACKERWVSGPSRSRSYAAEDLQSDAGPVRASRHHFEHLLGLAAESRRIRVWRDRPGRQIRRDVQGIPAALDSASFNPTTIMEETLDDIQEARKQAGSKQ